MRKIKLNMGVLVSLESGKYMFLRGTKHIMDFVDLVKLIFTWEQWEQRKNFKEDATHAPDIHLIVIITLCEKALRRPVPSCRYILSVPLALHPLAGSEVNKFDPFIL